MAKEFAAQGARLFLSGRTGSRVQAVADAISADGRTVAAVELDALDDDAVNRHVDQVVATAGRVDIVFNAIGPQPTEYGNATSTMDLPVEDTEVVGLIDVFVFKSKTGLKRHGKDYTSGRSGIGYVYLGDTLIVLSVLPPSGIKEAFFAAMKDLGARRKYVSKDWRDIEEQRKREGTQ